jgi:Bacterial Ig-like domain (group 3)
MVTLILRRSSLLLMGIVAASSIAVAQVSDVSATTPKITSVSTITTAQHQTITITGSGFGTHKAYTGDSPYISFYDQNKRWEAGYQPDLDTVTLIVHSWTNTKITLGGFAGKWGTQNFTLAVGNKEKIRIFNAQGAGGPVGLACPPGCATKTVVVAAALTRTEISSNPNPSVNGLPVTFTAVVTSGDGVPPDGGKVLFVKGNEILGSGMLHGGVARLTTSRLEFGPNSVRAVYAGDSDFEGTRRDDKSAVETHIVN